MSTARFAIERLTANDIGDNVALAHVVGWQDAASDWRVMHQGALVIGVRDRCRLIGQGALGLYGNAGTVAKMIVAPEFQRQGIGSRLLDALLEEANRRSVSSLGLVATALGRPLYERSGFVPTGEVVVLSGRLTRTDDPSSAASLDDEAVAPRAEERWISCSREVMLRARFREALATASVEGPRGSLLGYAMATSQGALTLIGPVMAETQGIARVVMSALSRSIPGAARIDVPAEQVGFRRWLEAHGFREQSVRIEMALGTEQLPWQVPERFALAAQAWG